ncbi:MAG: HlyD family efflux transporter periplasmic adaptor subunit [bacterium]
MSRFFSRSLRALRADSHRRSVLCLVFAAVVLVLWAIWFLAARVTLYEVSGAAMIELDLAAYSLDAPIGGRVVANHMVLGRKVQPGDLLVELDTASEHLMVAEERSQVDALSRQLDALFRELKAQRQAHYEYQQIARKAIDEARARQREAEVDFVLLEDEFKRMEVLRADGIVSEVDFLRTKAEMQKRQEVAEALKLRAHQLEWEEKNRQSESRVRREQIKRQIAMVKGEIAAKTLTIERLFGEIGKGSIRAPVAGQIDGMKDLRIGSVIHEGERCGTILTPGRLIITALFSASETVGRIRPGQRAQLRLDSFPWTQYGCIPARVARIASEVRDGQVRAELALDPNLVSSIPLQHGLSGSVEVEVDRTTPAELVLRLVGKLLTRPSKSFGSMDGPAGSAATAGSVTGGHNVR